MGNSMDLCLGPRKQEENVPLEIKGSDIETPLVVPPAPEKPAPAKKEATSGPSFISKVKSFCFLTVVVVITFCCFNAGLYVAYNSHDLGGECPGAPVPYASWYEFYKWFGDLICIHVAWSSMRFLDARDVVLDPSLKKEDPSMGSFWKKFYKVYNAVDDGGYLCVQVLYFGFVIGGLVMEIVANETPACLHQPVNIWYVLGGGFAIGVVGLLASTSMKNKAK